MTQNEVTMPRQIGEDATCRDNNGPAQLLRRRRVGERIRHSTSRMASAAAGMCHRAARVTTAKYPTAERRRVLYDGVQRRVLLARERTRKIAQVEFPSSVLLLATSILLPLATFIAAFKITTRVWQDEIWSKKGMPRASPRLGHFCRP